MEQLTKNQAVATSQEAVQNQNEPQLRDENAHNDKSVHGVLNPTYQAGLRRDAVQPDIEAERKKRDEIEAGKSYCSRRFGGATCDDKSAQIYRSEERRVGKECRARWSPHHQKKKLHHDGPDSTSRQLRCTPLDVRQLHHATAHPTTAHPHARLSGSILRSPRSVPSYRIHSVRAA